MENGPFWFICADHRDRVLFKSETDFKEAVNATAIAAARNGVKVYGDVYMSNHAHWIVGSCSREQAQTFYDDWTRHLAKWDSLVNGITDLRNWPGKIYEVPDLKAFRSMFAYLARNPYVAISDATPFGYRWGSADLFFNDNVRDYDLGVPYSSLSIRGKRLICRSKNIDLPERYRVRDGRILKLSYIEMPGTQSLFNSGNQYFNMLARNAETNLEIARMIGEKITLPDDEVFGIACSISQAEFKSPLKTLDVPRRLELARILHFEYGSNNRQISQILRLPVDEINRVFPIPQ